MNTARVHRLFLAIAIPEAVREELRRLQIELQPLLPSRAVRWARPEQFHLTLKFFGNVPTGDIVALSEAARAVCAKIGPLRLRAAGVGFFPNNSSPRVFWVEIQSANGSLARLQRQLEVAVRQFGQNDEKKFTAHVTLARFEKMPAMALEIFSARLKAGQFFGEWDAREVELIQSKLQPAGPLHAILDTFSTKNG